MDLSVLALLVSLGVLLATLATGINIGVTLMLASLVGSYVLLSSWTAGMKILFIQSMDVASSYNLMVIPLFILMGSIAAVSGIAGDLFTMFYRVFGRVKGGVAVATIGTCAGMASITGSSVATSATLARIALPELRRLGYQEALSVGAITVGGTLALMIPPSIPLVLFAIFADQSIGKMLVAGIIPGVIIGIGYTALILVRCSINPKLGPAGPRFSAQEKLSSLLSVIPFLLIVAAIVLGILFGIWTPVESAAGATVLVALMAFLRRKMSIGGLFSASRDAVVMSASIFIIVIGSLSFGTFLAMSGTGTMISEMVIGLELNSFSLFLLLVVIYLVLGMFMEVSSILALTIPLVMPIVVGAGWNPIWFGVILVSLMEVAAVTPPVGLNIYAVKSAVSDVGLRTIYIGSVQFWLINVLAILIIYFIPDLALILPDLMSVSK